MPPKKGDNFRFAGTLGEWMAKAGLAQFGPGGPVEAKPRILHQQGNEAIVANPENVASLFAAQYAQWIANDAIELHASLVAYQLTQDEQYLERAREPLRRIKRYRDTLEEELPDE